MAELTSQTRMSNALLEKSNENSRDLVAGISSLRTSNEYNAARLLYGR